MLGRMNLPTAMFRLWVADVGSQAEARKALGVSKQLVSAIFNGKKRISPRIAARVDALSAGKYPKERLVFGEAGIDSTGKRAA